MDVLKYRQCRHRQRQTLHESPGQCLKYRACLKKSKISQKRIQEGFKLKLSENSESFKNVEKVMRLHKIDGLKIHVNVSILWSPYGDKRDNK